MAIVAKYPEAKQAQLSRIAEVQDQVTEAFSERFKRTSKDRTAARIVASLLPALLGVIFSNWFEGGQTDVAAVSDHVLEVLCDVACSAAEASGKRSKS